MNITELEELTITELYEVAKDLDISGYTRYKKKELIVLDKHPELSMEKNVFNFHQEMFKFTCIITCYCI